MDLENVTNNESNGETDDTNLEKFIEDFIDLIIQNAIEKLQSERKYSLDMVRTKLFEDKTPTSLHVMTPSFSTCRLQEPELSDNKTGVSLIVRKDEIGEWEIAFHEYFKSLGCTVMMEPVLKGMKIMILPSASAKKKGLHYHTFPNNWSNNGTDLIN